MSHSLERIIAADYVTARKCSGSAKSQLWSADEPQSNRRRKSESATFRPIEVGVYLARKMRLHQSIFRGAAAAHRLYTMRRLHGWLRYNARTPQRTISTSQKNRAHSAGRNGSKGNKTARIFQVRWGAMSYYQHSTAPFSGHRYTFGT